MTEAGPATLAFSTLACPEWDADTVIRRAAELRFDAVEWRGGPAGTVRTTWSPSRRSALRSRLSAAGIRSVAVTSYSELISGDSSVRAASVEAIVRHADLALDLGASSVRVFLGVADDDAPAAQLERRAIDALAEALARVDRAVTLAIEPHDHHVRSSSVLPILRALPTDGLGVVWDIANAWSAGEPPEDGLAAYAGRIAYVQIKDGTGRGATWRLVEVGRGEVPLAAAITSLHAAMRAGGRPLPPLSVEWERAWHPELVPADQALPAARRWLTDLFAGLDENRLDRRGGTA